MRKGLQEQGFKGSHFDIEALENLPSESTGCSDLATEQWF